MRKILLSTIAIAALTGSAFASDLPSRKSAPAYIAPVSAYSWTGFYAGVEGGVDFLNANYNGFGTNHSNAGLLGGVVGYNHQINQFVLGLEGDAGGVLGGRRSLTIGTNTVSTQQTYFGDVRGRVGVAFDRALFYAAGGVAFGDVNSKYYNPAYLGSVNSGRVGWTLGGGVDYAITPNWIARVEYRYTDLGRNTDMLGTAVNTRVRNSSNAVLVGLMYKFGAPEPVLAKY